ncbi:biopolymer transport protein ExbB/TolQ [Lysobacter enzymogenes]|uniref:hypothetical protein n=1 Tax=Lysobacter enzymogenes TaxID=69 RepID=UPI003392E083
MANQIITETVLGMTDLQIKVVTALGQLALATAVAYVAWQQWRTARNKLKSDLFERRFKLVSELRQRVQKVRANSANPAEILTLPDLARETGFLFDGKVKDISERLVKALKNYDAHQTMLKDGHKQIKHLKEREEAAMSLDIKARNEEDRKIDLAKTQVNKNLAELTIEITKNNQQIINELKSLEKKTSQFLTLRH